MSDDKKPQGPVSSSKVTYLRRGSSLRARAPSSMPVDGTNLHSLYIAIANLQMTCSRQKKIRQALRAQLQSAEDSIAQAQREIAELENKIAAMEGASPRRAAPSGAAQRRSTEEAKSDDDDQGFVFDY